MCSGHNFRHKDARDPDSTVTFTFSDPVPRGELAGEAVTSTRRPRDAYEVSLPVALPVSLH